jgi:hypothetical protein
MTRSFFVPTPFIATAFAALAVITPVVVSSAQQPAPLRQPETVPFEVAAALVTAGGFSGEPQILVGSMPEWIANRVYVPSDARILGSAFLGTTVVAVISLPSASDTVIPGFTRELLKRGWTTPPPAPSYGGGFRPAPAEVDGIPTRTTLCSGEQVITVTAARRRGVATDVTIRVLAVPRFGPCHPQEMPAGMTRSPYPTLFNPSNATDARMMGFCTPNATNFGGTGTALRTGMTPDALLDHYGRQLQDSGWKPINDGRSVVSRTWTRPDSAGGPVELSLTVTTTAREAACREINLQVRKVQKP